MKVFFICVVYWSVKQVVSQVILEVVTNLKVMDETRQPNHIVLYCDEIDDVIHSSMAPLCGEKLLEIAEECLNHKYKKRAKIDQVKYIKYFNLIVT